MENFLRFYVFDLRNKTYRTLIEIPRTDVKGIIAYSRGADTDGRTLFVVFGGSILAIDIRSGQVHDFAEIHYTPQKITRLIVDRGKLVAFTQFRDTSIIDLKNFYAVSKPENTPYSLTANQLVPKN